MYGKVHGWFLITNHLQCLNLFTSITFQNFCWTFLFRYKVSLFSKWKQKGMFATCMWIVQLLLVLSDNDSLFSFVPEYYVETLVSKFYFSILDILYISQYWLKFNNIPTIKHFFGMQYVILLDLERIFWGFLWNQLVKLKYDLTVGKLIGIIIWMFVYFIKR